MSDFLKSNLNDLVMDSLRESPPGITQEAPPKKRGAPGWAQALNILGPLADGASTIYAMNQSGPMADGSGYVRVGEDNPIYGKNASPAKVMAVKGSQAALSALASHFFPKAAKGLGIANGAVGAAATGVNIMNANKAKKLRGID